MTWPLFLIFVVIVIALFFVLSVGMPRFFSWFKTLFLRNSLVSPYGKLPTLRTRRRRWLMLFGILTLGYSAFASSPALAYCDQGQTGETNIADCTMWSWDQQAYGATYTFYHTNQFPSSDQALVVTTSYALGPLGVTNSDWSNNMRIAVALGMSCVAVLFLDLCRRIILPKRW